MDNHLITTDVLHSIPWFIELNPVQISRLSAISRLVDFTENETIFTEGSREDAIYILLEGRISIEIHVPQHDEIQVFVAEPLDVFGWSSMTPVVRQRVATARALQKSQAICINSIALLQLCEEDHDIGYIIMRRIANVTASRFLTTRLHLYNILTKDIKPVEPNG